MRQRLRNFCIGTALAFAVLLGVAAGTPLMAVPDEPAHAVRAAAMAHGQMIGETVETGSSAVRFQVPEGIAAASGLACMAFDPRVTADCQADLPDDATPLVDGLSTAGLNLPTYYILVGWPALLDGGEAALWGMRIVSALLSALCIGVAVMEVRSATRSRWGLTAIALGATPMAVWLGGSLNPNGLEWSASLALLATLVSLGRQVSGTALLVGRLAVVLASSILLVSGRPVTLLWMLIAALAGLALAHRHVVGPVIRRWQTWVAIGACAAYAGLAALWTIRPPVYETTVTPVPGMGETFAQGFKSTWGSVVFYWRELVGIFGWKDTPAPDIVVVAYGAALVGFTAFALVAARGLARVALSGTIVSLLLVPPIIQGMLVTDVGYMWQGRYMLAVLGMILLVAGIVLDDRLPAGQGIGMQRFMLVVLAAAFLYTFVVVFHRFAVGDGEGWRVFLFDPSWSSPLGSFPTLALLSLAAVAVVAAVLVAGDGPRSSYRRTTKDPSFPSGLLAVDERHEGHPATSTPVRHSR